MGQVLDAITEWWTYPVATDIGDRVVGGAISSTGDILVWQHEHDTDATTRVVVGSGAVDDHNCPAVWARPGRRTLVIWHQHNLDQLLRVKVSDVEGSLGSLAAAPVLEVDIGGLCSYAQIHRVEHLSTAGADVFWVFTRRNTTTWWVQPLTVDQATGTVTPGTAFQLVNGIGKQCYLSVADAHAATGQVLRLAWGYNPAQPTHAVFYLEIDVVTGAITSPADPTVAANMDGTSLPIYDNTLLPLIPEPAAGMSRRLFYTRPGPAAPAVAFADWSEADPDGAVYRVLGSDGAGGWTLTELGEAGPRIGFSAVANYLPGLAFPDPAVDDTVAVARRVDGATTLTVVTDGTATTFVPSTEQVWARPVFPVNDAHGHLVASHVLAYGTSYTEYSADLHVLTAHAPTPVATTTDRSIRLICGDLVTGRILATMPATAGTWEMVHRDAGQLTAMLPASVLRELPWLPTYVAGPRAFLGARVGDTVLEAGPVWTHAWDGSHLRVGASGLWSIWDRRVVIRPGVPAGAWARSYRVWSDVSLSTIGRRLVALGLDADGGALPVDLPEEQAGEHERRYDGFDLQMIGDALAELMNVAGGPDLAFEPYLVDAQHVRWAMRAGTVNDPLLHQDGPAWVVDASAVRGPVRAPAVGTDWSNLASRAWATGEGMDKALRIAQASNPALHAASVPLLDVVASHPSVTRASTLQAHADRGVIAGAAPWTTLEVAVRTDGTPPLDRLRPGDWVDLHTRRDDPYLSAMHPGRTTWRSRVMKVSGGLGSTFRLQLAPVQDQEVAA